MCGIIGIINKKASATVPVLLLNGLKSLEYRGYDSAGIAMRNDPNAKPVIYKEQGKVAMLEQAMPLDEDSYLTGIGHTRWATHGKPKRENAHPFQCGDITLLCNGIVENYSELQDYLTTETGKKLVLGSETDTEILGFLLNHHYQACGNIKQAIDITNKQSKGSYAFLAMVLGNSSVYACMNGCPLVVGTKKNSSYISSDPLAISKSCHQYTALQQGDVIQLNPGEILWLASKDGLMLGDSFSAREKFDCANILLESEKGQYRHFFQKESHEVPEVIQRCLDGIMAADKSHIITSGLGAISKSLDQICEVHLVGCGSSNYSAMMGAYWIEHLSGIPAHCYVASEFLVNPPPVHRNTLWLGISQSGETADTLAALDIAKQSSKYLTTLAIVNVDGSMMQRQADHTILTKAGREICVLSTKTNSAQATCLLMFALALAQTNQHLASDNIKQILQGLSEVSEGIKTLLQSDQFQQLAPVLAQETVTSLFFLGRGMQFVVASEGALKMMEGAYLHAQSYAGGELKHGPLAFLHDDVPVIGLLPSNNPRILRKMLSNLEEVQARGAQVIIICSEAVKAQLAGTKAATWKSLTVPNLHHEVIYLAEVVAVQQLAYAVAIMRGTDIDQPRNLAKSVTVE